ncbi:MAG: serine/threonine protein kinase [Candidatus Latescibacteria bacterium]|nr:serine/threonine protein kinase [Candidatus Latescibacterota bacterium]
MKPVDPALWPRLETALEELLELQPAARARALATLGRQDPALRDALDELLAADARPRGILETGADDLARALLAAEPSPAEADDPEAPLPRVARYRLLRRLGRGGMGNVYLAERTDGDFGGPVALKLLALDVDTPELRARFLQERAILGRLEHPGIARLLDGGLSEDGRPYFALEYIEGQPITDDADARRLTLRERLRLFEKVCEAVGYAQQHLVVHRDLKPSNILVTPEGQVKLLDFGIAKLLAEAEDGEARTRTGVALMTPEYAAPEQLRGEPVTTATDVYALGLVLYELLAGRRAVDSALRGLIVRGGEREARPLAQALSRASREEEMATAAARRSSPAALRRQLRGEPATLVDTALRPEPERRYASAEAMLEDLRRLREGRPLLARPASAGYRLRKYLRRHRVAMGASAAVVIALALGLAATAWQGRVARQEAARAEAVRQFVTSLFTDANPDETGAVEVKDLLARGVTRVDGELAGQPALQAELLGIIGRAYVALGEYPAALPPLARSLALEHAVGGDVRQAEIALGGAEVEAMHLERADSLLRTALARFDPETERLDPERILALSNRAVLEQRSGHYDEAERLDREVLALDEERYGPEHPEVAADLNNLGTLYIDQGRWDEAVDVHRRALDLRERLLPPGNTVTPASLHNLAYALSKLGRSEEADSLYREAIARRQAIYPDGHPLLAGSLRELGALRMSAGDLAAADSLFSAALDMQERLLGEAHSGTAMTVNQRGVVAYFRGHHEAARADFVRAFATLAKVLPPGHPTTLQVGRNLEGTLRALGRVAAADSVGARLDSLAALADD